MEKLQSEKTTLVIMAAGIGSRFGEGIKQLEPVGLHGEIIMDYSVHDAIRAGFDKIIFIIRKDIRDAFCEAIGHRIEKLCAMLGVEVAYAYQELSDLPEGYSLPENRQKPWGTGQAVLSCKDMIDEPFAVINADDYYGKEAFVKMYNFLQKKRNAKERFRFSMAGFVLKNTLSENGGVTRGLCKVDEEGSLVYIEETPDITKTEQGIQSGGKTINPDSYVSMNMWGFDVEFMELLAKGFAQFLDSQKDNLTKAEFLVPVFIGQLLEENRIQVRVLKTNDKWFGVTYREDKASVTEAFSKLRRRGVYKEDLFSDLL